MLKNNETKRINRGADLSDHLQAVFLTVSVFKRIIKKAFLMLPGSWKPAFIFPTDYNL